jgi:hypothetical protein
MGSADWTEMSDGLNSASCDRGATSGMTPPNGGGSFVFGFNSLVTSAGAVAYYANQTNFSPMAKGASIRSAIQRGVSAADTGFAPMLFLGGQGTSVNDNAYILGLQDDEPGRIALRKGSLITGIPSASPGSNGILARSTATYAQGTWLHLRLDMIYNDNGDVLLQCFASDLGTYAVTAPTWAAIAGLSNFVDDALGVNSGSAPYTSGYGGKAFYTEAMNSRGWFDHIELIRQT